MNEAKRKIIRLQNYDYSQNGAYFVTICTNERKHLFGKIIDGQMILNKYGLIVEKNIEILSTQYDGINVDKYAIMPNHLHMLVAVRRARIVCVPSTDRTKMLIPKIMQTFKSSVTKQIKFEVEQNGHQHAYNACPTKLWQSRYHEHIIRDEQDYLTRWQYIETNPMRWDLDEYYTT